MMAGMKPVTECDHTKTYSGECAPKWAWICSKCLAAGEDSLELTPEIDQSQYGKLAGMLAHRKFVEAVK